MSGTPDHVARTLRLEGMEVCDVCLPTLGEFRAINCGILQSEAWAIHEDWSRQRPGDYGQLARRQFMTGAFFTAGGYTHAAIDKMYPPIVSVGICYPLPNDARLRGGKRDLSSNRHASRVGTPGRQAGSLDSLFGAAARFRPSVA